MLRNFFLSTTVLHSYLFSRYLISLGHRFYLLQYIQLWASKSFSFFGRNGDREGCGGSTAPGETVWEPFTSARVTEWRPNKSPLAPLLPPYFCVPANPSAFLFFVLGGISALRLAESSRPDCLWTACVPWACPRQQRVFFTFFPPSVCHADICLSTWDEQDAASEQAPAQAFCNGKDAKCKHKSRHDAALATSRWMALKLSRCAVRKALQLLLTVTFATRKIPDNHSVIKQYLHSLTII